MKQVLVALAFCSGYAVAAESGISANAVGKQLYESRCALCHRGTGPGVFMLERRLGVEKSVIERRSELTTDYVKTTVRWGVGSMPRFSRGEISDDELTDIINYLVNVSAQTAASAATAK